MRDKHENFERIARETFGFLETQYGFTLVEASRSDTYDIATLRYESAKVFVEMIYMPSEYEVAFYVGRKGIDDQGYVRHFSAMDLARYSGKEEWRDYRGYMLPDHHEGIDKCLAHLVRLLNECALPYLQGDMEAFEKLSQERTDYKPRKRRLP